MISESVAGARCARGDEASEASTSVVCRVSSGCRSGSSLNTRSTTTCATSHKGRWSRVVTVTNRTPLSHSPRTAPAFRTVPTAIACESAPLLGSVGALGARDEKSAPLWTRRT